MFYLLLRYYLYFLGSLFIAGLVMILFGQDWAMCYDLYLKVVTCVQDRLLEFYGFAYNDGTSAPAGIFDTGESSNGNEEDHDEDEDVFESEPASTRSGTTSESGADTHSNGSFVMVGNEPEGSVEEVPIKKTTVTHHEQEKQLAFQIGMDMCRQGVLAIANEDVRVSFTLAPDYRRYELAPLREEKDRTAKRMKNLKLKLKQKLRRRRRSSTPAAAAMAAGITSSANLLTPIKNRRQPVFRPRLLLFATLALRLGVLFPVRLAFLACSFLLLGVCCVINLIRPFTPLVKTRIAVIYCRMYTMACGFIIRFKGQENRPKRPGVICANHLSPNDVHVIFSDIPFDRDYLYLVTGQKHKGFIGLLEHLVEKMCPALWLERADAESRRRFSIEIVEAAKTAGPVILFPEGYCTNNSQVLQFRRAIFQEDITVYPVAIKQESRFGDSFWSENQFGVYLLRILTSWAIVYNIHYMAPQQRRPDESATDFAARVQRLIASRLGVAAVPYDGGLWYKELERRKMNAAWQRRCAMELKAKYIEEKPAETVAGEGSNVAEEMSTLRADLSSNETMNTVGETMGIEMVTAGSSSNEELAKNG